MSLHKQSDVKNHLSPRYRTKLHLFDPVSNAAGLSVDKSDATKAAPLGFAEDFLAEHSRSGKGAPAGVMAGSISTQVAEVSKSKRA